MILLLLTLPTYKGRANSTRIDITLTKDLRYDIWDWLVDRNYNTSDHSLLIWTGTINLAKNLEMATSRLG